MIDMPTLTTPTMYFIGVSTTQSSIMKVFPLWMDILGIDAQIQGYDAPLRADPATYQRIVAHIQSDPMARGALVTAHKIDLLNATREMFNTLDTYATICSEVSCIAVQDDGLHGFAKDPISSGLTWAQFVPAAHPMHDADVFCMGAGGAATAISIYLATRENSRERPKRFIAVDIHENRLEHLRTIHATLDTDIAFEYVLNESAAQNDAILTTLAPGSVVINATGMGKDLPGSPLTDNAVFPENGIVWELNYRGERQFLQQAQRQQQIRKLIIEDGWRYFLHGWTQVIAEIFRVDLTPELFAELDAAASALRPA
ncbi:MAG: shikimate dehydrogenase [Aggregatilineales bacterium]